MQVREVMTTRPEYLSIDATIREAAERMSKNATGFEPLVQGDRIAGTVTDRDIAVRAMAEGRNPDDKVSTIATKEVLYTFEDEDVLNALRNMQEQKVQRLVVLNNANDKDLSGVVTLGDIADHCNDDALAKQIVNSSKHYH